MANHTPTPWKVVGDHQIVAADNGWVAECDSSAGDGRISDQDRANAELIVRAVNSLPYLVQALKNCIQEIEEPHKTSQVYADGMLIHAKKALELARGES